MKEYIEERAIAIANYIIEYQDEISDASAKAGGEGLWRQQKHRT